MLFIARIIMALLAGTVVLSLPEFIKNIRELADMQRLFAKVKISSNQPSLINEGKLVLISGELEMVQPAVDREENREFDMPVVRRTDEIYSSVKDASNGRHTHGWGISADGYLVGRAVLGGFEIDQELLAHVPCEKYIEMVPGKHGHTMERINYQTYKTNRMTMMGLQKEGCLYAARQFGGQDVFLGSWKMDQIYKKSVKSYKDEIRLSAVLMAELVVLVKLLLVM